MTFRVSPGVYPRIIDDSIQPNYTNPSIAAAVGGARRGPLGPRYITSYKTRKLLYGASDPSWGHFVDCCDAYLSVGRNLYMNRVVASDAKYGLGLVSNNKIAGVPAGTSFTTIPSGSDVPFDQVNRTVKDIEFVGTFVSDTSIAYSVNGTSGTVAFATNHEQTMTNLRQALQSALDGLSPGGFVWLIPLGSQHQQIRVVSPQAITLSLTATTSGSGAPTAAVRDADWLCFVTSQNPGKWSANDSSSKTPGVAVGITNVDVGIPERKTMSFSQALVTGNTFAMTVNGHNISVAFATDNNTTLNAIAAAYVSAMGGGSASVVASGSGGSGNRQIVFVAPDSATSLSFSAISITGGVSQALVTYTTTLNATSSTGGFNFVVYENANFVQPDELFSCTYNDGTDGLGNPTGLGYVINDGPRKSPRVRVTVNPFFSGKVYGSTSPTNSNLDRYLGGGLDGSLPSTQQVVAGWDDFANPEKITVRILINCGYATPEVHQKMVNLAKSRMDCIAILDTPSDQQDPQDAVNYRNNVMNIDSMWGALYTPDVLIYDQVMGARRYVPPSGLVAAQYAYTDQVAREWFAPAGLTRGLISQALDLRVIYDEGDRDLLSSAQVNAIRKFGPAFPIWGEYTLQQQMSALQSVPVVRLMIKVITEAANVVAYSVFEPNNPFTWHRIRTRVNAVLDPIEQEDGITDKYVQCDETNNTPDVIDQRVCKVAMWIKPTLSILYLQLDAIVTRQSATFSVEMVASSNQY